MHQPNRIPGSCYKEQMTHVFNLQGTLERCAIKILRKKGTCMALNNLKQITNEINLLKSVNHVSLSSITLTGLSLLSFTGTIFSVLFSCCSGFLSCLLEWFEFLVPLQYFQLLLMLFFFLIVIVCGCYVTLFTLNLCPPFVSVSQYE